MKLSSVFSVLALGSLSVQAQYYSEGWKPGQDAQPSSQPDGETYTPGQTIPADGSQPPLPVETAPPKRMSLFEMLDPDRWLGIALDKMGFNVTAKMDEKTWDERIEMITDDNYQELIVNETFVSEQEAVDRVWAIVVTVSGSKTEPLSKLFDDMFDAAYQKSIEANDLPNVRWGRIDYFKVTYLTTKWNVWKAPYLILLKDRGQTLHFFSPGSVKMSDDLLREFLKTEGYQKLTPWSGAWAPGGEREWMLDLFARYMAKGYNNFTKVPRWIMFMVTGAIGSFVLSFLHKPAQPSVLNRTTTASDRAGKAPAPAATASASKQAATSSPATPSKGGAKQRRKNN